MPEIKNLTRGFLLCFAVLFFALPNSSFAQDRRSSESTTADGERTLQALLEEVRHLRITLERLNLSAYRAQILVERLRAQQARVDHLKQSLDSIRNEINDMALARPRVEEFAKDMEAKMNAGTVEEMQYKMAKAEVDQLKQREQQLRDREIILSTELEVERNILTELNGRLDALEREMATMPFDDKNKQEEKPSQKKP